MIGDLKFLIHNAVAHPIAGWLWFFGLTKAGNAAHSICKPEESRAERLFGDPR